MGKEKTINETIAKGIKKIEQGYYRNNILRLMADHVTGKYPGRIVEIRPRFHFPFGGQGYVSTQPIVMDLSKGWNKPPEKG